MPSRPAAPLLVDAKTGEVLYARNPDERLLPASTTKLMTALIVYEKLGGLQRQRHHRRRTTAPSRATSRSCPAKPSRSTRFSTPCSSNRPTTRPARWAAPSPAATTAFVDMMNQRALAMGLFNTHFYNPNGLPAPAGTHYTSCADLMKIFQAVLQLSRSARDLEHEGIHDRHRLGHARPAQS